MQNLYPLFEQNRILKKELLWSLRDYSFGNIQLEYREYAEGIISGCQVKVRDTKLVMEPGIVKWAGFVYLIQEEMPIDYQAANRMEYLKLSMEKEVYSQDYVAYRVDLVLDAEPKKEKELEVCRFHLREGAKLRAEYTDFYDMQTEYDTIIHIQGDWGGLGQPTLSPVVTGCYAQAVMEEKAAMAEDVNFAWICKNERRTVSVDVIKDYVKRRGICAIDKNPDRQQLFEALAEILGRVQNGTIKIEMNEKKQRKIIVD